MSTVYQPSSRMPGILFKWKGKTHDVLNINTNRKAAILVFHVETPLPGIEIYLGDELTKCEKVTSGSERRVVVTIKKQI